MLSGKPILLNDNFNQVLTELDQTLNHFFITGKAGTGKSTLLKLFRKTTKKKVVVLAPTGVAALNVKGQTIHSFFGFPPKLMDSRSIHKRKNRKLFQQIDTIIIDEISMVRADLIDHIDEFLKINREIDLAFGGIQMIFFGDLYQLPPVVSTQFEKHFFKTTYNSPYFFDAHILEDDREVKFQLIELTTVYRQEERGFVSLLDLIRKNQCDYDDLEYINERYQPSFVRTEGYITLCTRNSKADLINKSELAKIESPIYSYRATIEGLFDPRLYPTSFDLNLKVGAQVMLIKNDPTKRFVNGTIAKVETLTDLNVGVSMLDDAGKKKFLELEKAEWQIIKYKFNAQKPNEIESDVIGVFKQFPIKLAWAVTIHKSQGKTFDRIIIDLGKGAFAHGQTYVALSRCRTLEGIVLTQPVKLQDIFVDPVINEYYDLALNY